VADPNKILLAVASASRPLSSPMQGGDGSRLSRIRLILDHWACLPNPVGRGSALAAARDDVLLFGDVTRRGSGGAWPYPEPRPISANLIVIARTTFCPGGTPESSPIPHLALSRASPYRLGNFSFASILI
jgi:hypothetical protein